MNVLILAAVLFGQVAPSERLTTSDLLMTGPSRIAPADLLMTGPSRLAVAKPVVRGVMITADWCGPCRAFKKNEIPRLEKVGWKVGSRDTDHLQLIDHADAGKYGASSLPTFIRLVDGEEFERRVGSMDAIQLAEFIYPAKSVTTSDVAASPTPIEEVDRALRLLPRPEVGFVDFGCGDGRVLMAAARLWEGVPIIGVEIDPARAAATRERVRNEGLDHRITIITGDAITTPVKADVFWVYLYHDALAAMQSRLAMMRAGASYLHQPPGLPVIQNGDSWFYAKDGSQQARSQSGAVWAGQVYSAPVCNRPGCAMCNSIRQQLSGSQQRNAASVGINPPSDSVWWQLFSR